MATRSARPKLLAVVGPTASGKSALAMRVALEFGGEIIAADSRTVYKGMDIGTAKPSLDDRSAIPHWGLDLVEPGQRFTAYQFKSYAQAKVSEIQGRGNLPIIVGGTGLYVDALLYDFKFGKEANQPERSRLENLSVEKLQAEIVKRGYSMPENSTNKRHLVRTIERAGDMGGRRPNLGEYVLLIGLDLADKKLRESIDQRAGQIFASGVVDETKSLIEKYGRSALEHSGGLVYKIVPRLINGELTQQQAAEQFKTADWQYARRQRTWFKRNKDINWFSDNDLAYKFIQAQLNK